MVGLIAHELGSDSREVKDPVHTLRRPHPLPDLCNTLLIWRAIVTPPLDREFHEDVKGNPVDGVSSLNITGCIVPKVVLKIGHWRGRRRGCDQFRFLDRSDIVPVIVTVLLVHWKRRSWGR
jgi:hypothetical protein